MDIGQSSDGWIRIGEEGAKNRFLHEGRVRFGEGVQIAGIIRQVGLVVGRDGEAVAALILWMPGVAFEPMERDMVPAPQGEELLPEIRVLDLGEPFPFPVEKPALGDGFGHIR